MSRHHEPNASHYSARYAERKRAVREVREGAAGPSPCNRCPTPRTDGSIFCEAHAIEHAALVTSGASFDVCAGFCRRTYWPS